MEPEISGKAHPSPVALVFTDMVGSSAAKRAASLGGDSGERDAAFLAAIQIRHFKVIRDCMHEFGGTEIMTMGDAFFLTFPDVRSAVLCSAEIQMRLKSQPIMTAIGPMQLRIGIHCGTPKFVDNNWHGKDVDTAGKVEASASADQVVISEAARELLGEVAGVRLHPLGTFALKGVGVVPLWDVDYDGQGPRKPQVMSIEESDRLERRKLLIRSSVVSLVAIVLLTGWLWHRHRELATLTPHDKLLLTSFANETGDPLFDGTMQQALTVQLDQSPSLRLVSADELRAGLQTANQSPDQAITPALARSLCGRMGIRAYAVGAISRQGSGYRLTLDVFECAGGDSLAHASERAGDKDHVLSALAHASSTLREDLGEPFNYIEHYASKPLTLEAAHALAKAQAAEARGARTQALALYRQTITLDPDAAWAYARIGSLEEQAGDQQAAVSSFAKAYDLREHASERQRLTISAEFAAARGNLPAAIAAYQQLLKTYPHSGGALESLGQLYTQAGDDVRAASYFERASSEEPWDAEAAGNLALSWLALSEQAKAKKAIDAGAALSNASSAAGLISARMVYAFETGDPGWPRLIAAASPQTGGFLVDQTAANLLYLTGQASAARTSVEHGVAAAVREGSPRAAGNLLATAALAEAEFDTCSQVPSLTQRALGFDASLHTLPAVALAQVLCGQQQGSVAALHTLAQQFPESTRLNEIYLPEVTAAVSLLGHHPDDVHALLESTRPYSLASDAPNLEARADLATQHPEEALLVLSPVLKQPFNGVRRGMLGERAMYGTAVLLAARANAARGNAAAAIEEYDRAIKLWKQADAGFEPLREAQSERAALISRKPLQ
jgi:class 3 adenylate cyclase/tetratricopeptide (TPR) repeat protein